MKKYFELIGRYDKPLNTMNALFDRYINRVSAGPCRATDWIVS